MDPDNPLMDAEVNVHRLGLEGWGRFFGRGTREAGKLYFEGTTHLIYQRTALSLLPGLPTRPKLIFLLRDPIDRLASSFVYTQNNLAQVKRGFTLDQYLEMVAEERLNELDRYILRKQSAYVLQRDVQYSNYWLYLQRWLDAVGSERMLVLQFERLLQQPAATMTRICNFLQISPSCFENGYDYPAHNLTVRMASTSVHRWAQRVANVIPAGPVRRALSRSYYWMQGREPERRSGRAQPRSCQALRGRLGEDTLTLARQFNLDLRLWKSIALAAGALEANELPLSQSRSSGAGERAIERH